MTRQVIDTTTDHGTYRGDPGKTAWDKANLNFEELYQLFQTAANKLGYFDGNGKPAFTALTAFARSLLDDADAPTARATLQLGTAALAAAVGTVSTADAGALMEVGQNANGIYIRFKGNVQICFNSVSATTVNGSVGTGAFNFAAAFAAAPMVIPTVVTGLASRFNGTTSSVSSTAVAFGIGDNGGGGILINIMYIAIGRWY